MVPVTVDTAYASAIRCQENFLPCFDSVAFPDQQHMPVFGMIFDQKRDLPRCRNPDRIRQHTRHRIKSEDVVPLQRKMTFSSYEYLFLGRLTVEEPSDKRIRHLYYCMTWHDAHSMGPASNA